MRARCAQARGRWLHKPPVIKSAHKTRGVRRRQMPPAASSVVTTSTAASVSSSTGMENATAGPVCPITAASARAPSQPSPTPVPQPTTPSSASSCARSRKSRQVPPPSATRVASSCRRASASEVASPARLANTSSNRSSEASSINCNCAVTGPYSRCANVSTRGASCICSMNVRIPLL